MRAASSALALVALVATARADSPADEAFKRGRDLLKQGDAAGACAAFEESLHADFQYGTLFNIAQCTERQGKLASAWAAYHRLAVEDTNATRRAKSAAAADFLLPRVPRLAIDLEPADVANVGIAIDGVDVIGSFRSVPADPGERVVTVSASGYREAKVTANAVEATTTRVHVVLEKLPPPAPTDKPVVGAAPARPSAATVGVATPMPRRNNPLRTVGIATAIGGAVVFAGGVVFALHQKTIYDNARAQGDVNLANHAGGMADVASVICGIGGAAVIAGGVLWWRSHVTVTVAPDRAQVALRGSF